MRNLLTQIFSRTFPSPCGQKTKIHHVNSFTDGSLHRLLFEAISDVHDAVGIEDEDEREVEVAVHLRALAIVEQVLKQIKNAGIYTTTPCLIVV